MSHSFFCSPQQVIHGPILDVLTDHAGSQECGRINDHSGLVCNVDDGVDILNRGAKQAQFGRIFRRLREISVASARVSL